jgi:tetratricopeptide (TPR) repeat protein
MHGVCRWWLLGSVLLANVGCMTVAKQMADPSHTPEVPTVPNLSAKAAVTATKDLSQNETAQLCLEMATQLEKVDKERDAIIYYEKARQLEPKYQETCSRRLAVLYDRIDEQARAMNEYQRLLERHPKDSKLLNDIGYSYYNRGQWQQAESYLQKAVKADRSNSRAWINLGLTLAQLGKKTEALEAFQHAVSPAEAHANLGFILSANGRKHEAIHEYETALALEPALYQARQALEKLKQSPERQPTKHTQTTASTAQHSVTSQ